MVLPSFFTRTIAVAAVAFAVPAIAGAGPLQVTSKVFIEAPTRAADGSAKMVLMPAKKAVPGDRVVFVLAYRNTGAQPLDRLVFDNPLPAGIAYRAPAQGSAAPELSVDGKTYGPLSTLRVAAAGAPARPARADDVTHVRWRLNGPLAANGQGQFAFQAVLK